jgi:acyl-CoA synthetase (AMP-forming)/AMP-acid ligase II/thioesterase domain-containing protein/acyl carrier protein
MEHGINLPITVHATLGSQAIERPHSPALLAPGRDPLDYASLLKLVRNVEANLREWGIGSAHPVGLALPNGPEMASAFAALAASAVCAPLNPQLGEREHRDYLAELGAGAVVVEERTQVVEEAARSLGIMVIRLVSDPGAPAGWFRLERAVPAEAGAGTAMPEGTAMVLPTSGTTARPKLVPLSHRNLCASGRNIRTTLALTCADRCLNVMPLFHIHGLIAALWSSLSAGASVVCTPGYSGRDFLGWLNESGATWYTAVPTIHQSVAQSLRDARASLGARVRLVRSSSASLAPSVMEEIEALFDAPMIEAYGMTEASHQMASNPLPPAARKPGSVGPPAGPQMAVMNEEGGILGPGEIGEVVIRGENVVRSYWNNDAANADAFRDGWFRTGDQGRWDGDGYLYLTGRSKELINRGGEKIAPREVEEALLEHPAVAQAVSFAIPHRTLGEDVGAAVVTKAGCEVKASELRQFASARLAAFKTPRTICLVADIPKGPTGKLQRIGLAKRLGIGAPGDAQAGEEYVPPASELEERLAAAWRDTLQAPRVGRQDDFFALGGDSLAAVEMLARVSVEEGVELPQVSLYDCPTLREFSSLVQEAVRASAAAPARRRGLVPIHTGGAARPLFVSAGHLGRFGQFCRLSRLLGPGQPVLGFPAPILTPTENHYRIEGLAAWYLQLMRAHQPEGPYSLMGDCLGGFVVFEMARQLLAAGEQVDFLCMMNCYNAGPGEPIGRRDEGRLDWGFLRRRLARELDSLRRRPVPDWIPLLRDGVRGLAVRAGRAFRWRLYRLMASRGGRVPPMLLSMEMGRTYALESYRPGIYEGGALFVRTVDERSEARLMGWQGMIRGPVEIVRLPHEVWRDEGVAAYGPEVAERLKRARAACAG